MLIALLTASVPLFQAQSTFTLAYACWHPSGKAFIFQANPKGDYDLFLADSDGKGVKALIKSSGNDGMPVWSPDGSSLLFISDRDGNREVYVCKPDGSEQRNLTNHSSMDFHAAWSRDGKRIIFSSDRSAKHDDDFDLYVVNADGTALRKITDGPEKETYASWSPDGTQLVTRKIIESTPGKWNNSEVFLLDNDGRNGRNLTVSPKYDGWPVWAPDGKWIAFSSGIESDNTPLYLWLMKRDGSGKRPLSHTDTTEFTYHTQPAFSPDGKYVLFTRYFTRPGPGEYTEICVVSTDPGQAGQYKTLVRCQDVPST
jgi:TolB protein